MSSNILRDLAAGPLRGKSSEYIVRAAADKIDALTAWHERDQGLVSENEWLECIDAAGSDEVMFSRLALRIAADRAELKQQLREAHSLLIEAQQLITALSKPKSTVFDSRRR